MSVTVNETEAKYEADPDTVLPSLDDLPQVAETAQSPVEVLEAVYFDTPDLRLLRAGITLRRRTGGGDAGWHLKLPVGGRTREEVRLPLDSALSPQEVPRDLANLVRARGRGVVLVPVATVTTHRHTVNLLDAAGHLLAEVADDRVSAERPHDPAAADSWREIEVELAEGGTDLLMAVDELLRRHGLHPSGRSAKLERVLWSELTAANAAASPSTGAQAYRVITAYLAAQAEELTALDPMARRFQPDAVHRMRVATRRMRSTLRTFARVLRPDATEHIADELKWLGDVLGQVRDAEVLASHLRAQQEQTDVAQLLGPVSARIDAHFARTGADARAAVLTALDSKRYTVLLTDLDTLIADPPLGPAAEEASGAALAAAVADSYRTTRRRMRRALAAPAGQGRDAALHQARKAAKRARYAAEAVSSVAGQDARRFAGQMQKVQSVLGDYQDTVIARQLERSLSVAAHLAGENAFSYGLFYERDVYDARMLQDLARQIWRNSSRRRYRRWLAGALGC
jgi:CHAD domain-containing protein